MVQRHFWLDLIEYAWRTRSVIWLSGVRRVGKTCLCQSLSVVEYFDCELPRVRRMLVDPQSFLDGLRGRRIVLDEIHRLSNPSELLKIAADHYRTTHILATGSSTLGASTKFRDTLTGHKNELMIRTQRRDVAYWRDKRGHEVDFVLARRGKKPLAIECKWSADNFAPTNLRAFRQQHPEGDNVVVAQDVDRTFTRSLGGLRVRFESLDTFAAAVAEGLV